VGRRIQITRLAAATKAPVAEVVVKKEQRKEKRKEERKEEEVL